MSADRVFRTIRGVEQEIRGLIGEAATIGAYDLVARLSVVARRLSELADPASGGPAPAVASALAAETPVAKPVSRAARRLSPKDGYPRFEKSRDVLVKIGWSKKGRNEYVHRAPKAGVYAVTRRVIELGKGGQVFTTEDLLPVKLSGVGDELPGYQAYICLAWLRAIGAVEQHGREGYSTLGDDLQERVTGAWDALPASRR